MGRPICNQKWLISGGLHVRKSEEGRQAEGPEWAGPFRPKLRSLKYILWAPEEFQARGGHDQKSKVEKNILNWRKVKGENEEKYALSSLRVKSTEKFFFSKKKRQRNTHYLLKYPTFLHQAN